MQSEYATTYRSIPERSSAVLLNAATRVLHPACRGDIPCANSNCRTLTLNGEARVTKLRGTPAPPWCVEPRRNVGEWGQDKEAFVRCGAAQCGICTPGFLLTARALLDENPHPSRDEVREALAGNLCRCTGYQKIVDAVCSALNAEESV